ncbi:hypothetical protein AVEN_77244-1 [Araneus ventricosus]|uniref:Uncharacterized protein n=1 Tax=Araneus ventricosus TaxID=182803 RepID=A0A4Y2Q342_ARAVE|nr:hypothetical protein AVEN_77244-1 [Araneus ventricosus]
MYSKDLYWKPDLKRKCSKTNCHVQFSELLKKVVKTKFLSIQVPKVELLKKSHLKKQNYKPMGLLLKLLKKRDEPKQRYKPVMLYIKLLALGSSISIENLNGI